MSLTDKQRYYRYGASGWSYKEQPTLDPDIVTAMKRDGLDETYRIIFGGVAIYRTEPTQLAGEVKGDRRATLVNEFDGYLVPTYVYGHARQPVRDVYVWTDDLGNRVSTVLKDLVPPGKTFIIEVQYHYVSYGILNWFVEQLHEGEWHCIKRLETPEGFYYEPDMRTVMWIREREYQNRNEDLDDVVKREREVRAKFLREQGETEDRKKHEMAGQMAREHMRRLERAARYSYSSN